MPDSRSGLAKDVAAAGPLGMPTEPETIDLFDGEPHTGSPVDEAAKALGVSSARVAGRRGRREGSRNVVTADVVKFLSANYRHPLLGMADVAATSPEQLASLIAGGKTVAPEDRRFAWSMWFQCSKELAEYMATKQPRALSITPDSAPLLQVFLDQHQGEGGGSMVNVTQFGFQENPMKTTEAKGVGDEVLESEVLQQPNNPENSNG